MQKQIPNFYFPVQFYCISPFCYKYFIRDCKLKEMTCLLTIAQTKNTFSAFKFFHKHYWNSGSRKLIAAVRGSNLKSLELWKSITWLYALRKNNSSDTKAASERCF